MSDGQSRRRFLSSAGRLGLSAAGIALLGGCAPSPMKESSAPVSRVATIGYLGLPGDEGYANDASRLDLLRQGLRELGWVEGETLRIEVRLAPGGDPAALPALTEELAGIPVDVIVAQNAPASIAAGSTTSTVPIVMVRGSADPVARGLALSIQRPGRNVTGNTQPPPEIDGKRLEVLVEAVPHASRVAYLASGNPRFVEPLRETARVLGIQLQVLTPQSEPELALEAIASEAPDAMLVNQYPLTVGRSARILDFAAQRRLPVMYETRPWAAAGGLMSYDANHPDLVRRAASYVDRILRGANPGDLPIELPTRYDFVINLKAAEDLGLTIPESTLAQASEVIR